jgi:hypothetical protein
MELGKLVDSLRFFNVSQNSLSGSLPNSRFFESIPYSFISHNAVLCSSFPHRRQSAESPENEANKCGKLVMFGRLAARISFGADLWARVAEQGLRTWAWRLQYCVQCSTT